MENVSREKALALLRKYNKEPFHLQHAFTVEGVMRWFAEMLGYAQEADFWACTGLLHDIDYEQFPQQHCLKAPELLKEGGFGDEMIHAVCSHGYGLVCDVEPTRQMEKFLFATDEFTGLIWAAAKMRPTGFEGMDSKSVMKKFKDKRFAAGCSREVITKGAEMLGMTVPELAQITLDAMRA